MRESRRRRPRAMLVLFRNRLRRRHLLRFVRPASLRRTLIRFAIYLLIVMFAHVGAMMTFEGLTFGEAWWLTLRRLSKP